MPSPLPETNGELCHRGTGLLVHQKELQVWVLFRYPLIVSDIFSTETPKLINLFFEKFEELESSDFMSVDEEHIPEEVNHSEGLDKEEKVPEDKLGESKDPKEDMVVEDIDPLP